MPAPAALLCILMHYQHQDTEQGGGRGGQTLISAVAYNI